MQENRDTNITIPNGNGAFRKIKRIEMHYDLVDENGAPYVSEEGMTDTGNYVAIGRAESLAGLEEGLLEQLAGVLTD